jgi:hypothetical protein
MTPQVIKRRKKWKLDDLTPRDMDLLSTAAHLPEKTWFCFGISFYKLFDLKLVDEETMPTFYGRELVKAYARISQ